MMQSSQQMAAATSLFVECWKDSVAELAYPATTAGLEYDLSALPQQGGLQVHVGGFDDKLLDLLKALLVKFVKGVMTPSAFSLYKESVSFTYQP